MKKILISLIITNSIILSACSNPDNNYYQNNNDSSSSESLIFTGSNVGDEVMEHLNKTERDEYSLRMKFKTDDKVLTIYSIKGYRTYENMSDYYISILRSLKKTDLSDYELVKIKADSFDTTFNVNTIKALPLSNTEIKNLGYTDDGDVDYDEFIDNYLRNKAITYTDKSDDE